MKLIVLHIHLFNIMKKSVGLVYWDLYVSNLQENPDCSSFRVKGLINMYIMM